MTEPEEVSPSESPKAEPALASPAEGPEPPKVGAAERRSSPPAKARDPFDAETTSESKTEFDSVRPAPAEAPSDSLPPAPSDSLPPAPSDSLPPAPSDSLPPIPNEPPVEVVPVAPPTRLTSSVSSMSPRRASAQGGTRITLFGAGFSEESTVQVGSADVDVEFIDAFTLRFEAPAGSQPVPVVVGGKTDARVVVATLLEFAEPPTIEGLSPGFAPPEGAVMATLIGTGFEPGMTLNFFGHHAPEVTVDSPTELRFLVPPQGAAPSSGTLTVTQPSGLSASKSGLFVYRELDPEIHDVTPKHAWINGGKRVRVVGRDFHPRGVVRVAGAIAEFEYRSPTELDVTVPERETPGEVALTIHHWDGKVATFEGFRYEPLPTAPKLLSVLPAVGSTVGRAIIRIHGDHFRETLRVRIGEVSAITRFVSEKLVDVELPPRPTPGPVAIELQDGDLVVRFEEAFVYESPAKAVIGALEPRTGLTGQEIAVVLTGERFSPESSVRFGGEPCKRVVVKSSTELHVLTPRLRAAGLVDVEVSSPEAGTTVAPKAFRFDAPAAPILTLVSPQKGTTEGGTELSLEGKNFGDGAQVLIGGVPATRVKRVSGSVLEAFTPKGDDGKMVDVMVKNPDGQTAIMKRAFQYDARYRS